MNEILFLFKIFAIFLMIYKIYMQLTFKEILFIKAFIFNIFLQLIYSNYKTHILITISYN